MAHKPCAPLAGLSMLVVRPQRENDAFVERVTELGCRVYALPVMTINPLIPDERTRQILAGINRFQKVIVVSGNAARLVIKHIPQLPTQAVVPAWFAVGESTASTLMTAGIPVTFPADNPTSEGLLALPGFARVRGENILIVRGEGGRDKLRTVLEQRDAVVTFCELYSRAPDDTHQTAVNSLLAAGEVQVVAAHSVDVLRHLLELLGSKSRKSLGAIAVLVPSQAAADLAQEAGCGTVIRAQSALPASMVDALVGWYTANSVNRPR